MVDYTFIRKDIIKRITVIEGVVEAVSPIRIGVGKSGGMDPASIVKDTVLKDVNGVPIIPGSSWKGVFRSTGETILRSKRTTVCSGIGRDYCLNNYKKYEDFRDNIKNSDISAALEIFWKYTCLNCKLFGTMSVIGAVKFLDSRAIEYTLGTRTMVAISRTEGASARGALVQVEFVEPGSKFSFKLMGTNLPNYAIGYLLTIMKRIHDGYTQIGGHKSRGFGFVKFARLSLSNIGEKKIGEDDIEIQQEKKKQESLNKIEENKDNKNSSEEERIEANGDEFFEKVKPYMEAFKNAKIQYPIH